jgi:sialic acid synthase SpsE
MGHAVTIAAISIGACVVEKHLTMSRSDGGPDSAFSMEPKEFAEMVKTARLIERALGMIQYGPTACEEATSKYRRSLFVCEDVASGEIFTEKNIRSIRPGAGLHTRYYSEVLGKRARFAIARGLPLSWEMID